MMPFRLVFLWSDCLLFLSIMLITFFVYRSTKREISKMAFKNLFKRQVSVISFAILIIYLLIALLDSMHFQSALDINNNGKVQYSNQVKSVLDVILGERSHLFEKTYSAPFALRQFVKETKPEGGQYYPKLKYIKKGFKNTAERDSYITATLFKTFVLTIIIYGICYFSMAYFKRGDKDKPKPNYIYIASSLLALFLFISLMILAKDFHVLGTGKVGQDIFYYSLKSIRTGLVIGLITTLIMLPFAIILGISAGFFGGLVDDVIQYIYITISSVPGVLLIAASVLSMHVFIVNHPEWFSTITARSDARLVALCLILGLTSWTGLCRLLRAETMKIKEIDYISAAISLGSSRAYILSKHILPNVMHIVLISVALDFSFLVLAEAVLSYIGVGVSPLTISWGNMINGARLELAREPIVWWPMISAFVFMVILVLSANLFADNVRDVFDPRTSHEK